MAGISNDIILQILQWVPAGSLVRLRWACKYVFDSITRDHDFIKMQCHYSTQSMINSTVSVHSVLISMKEDDYTEKLFHSYLNYNTGEGEEEVASSSSPVRIAFPFEPYHFEVLGSCNGLILLRTISQNRTIIWNPCTNEYKVIPNPPIEINSKATYGLGYDNTLDDYKLIRVSHLDILVYTMGTNSWKSIIHVSYLDLFIDEPYLDLFSDEPYLNLSSANGVFVNGALHWLHPAFGQIFSFDIVKEKFQKISMSIPREWHMHTLHLQQFKGSLCVNSYDDISKARVEIWIVNKDSWTKLYTYSANNPTSSSQLDSFRQLRFIKNGGMLILKNDSYLCLCGSNNDRMAICCENCSVKEVYIESLVSLKSGTYLYKSGTKRNKEEEEEEEEDDDDDLQANFYPRDWCA